MDVTLVIMKYHALRFVDIEGKLVDIYPLLYIT